MTAPDAQPPTAQPATGARASGAAGTRPRVVVLRALGLGDLLTVVPALRGLRRAYPEHEIVLAAPARFADVVAAIDAVDRLLPTVAPAREVPTSLDWEGPPPEVAVDLHGNGPLSHDLLDTLRPGHIISWAHPGHDGPTWREDEHERVRWCRLLRWHGITADPDDVRLDVVCPPGPGAVLLHPGADAASRRWPPDRFAAVARALSAAGLPVLITAGHGERALAESVATLAGLPPETVVGGSPTRAHPTADGAVGAAAAGDGKADDGKADASGGDVPFGVLARRIAGARAVVVGDTGIAHLASAVGTPSVVLFGPVSPALWGPPEHSRHRVIWHPDDPTVLRPGDAHGTTPDARLLRVDVKDVLEELDALGIPTEPALSGAAQ
ncbi:glycosyltransferase family 9 protein [Cryptosporangium sp. NPDC048952]|uniref:glycosyltransferase family 9 protein n=1 Tax=Cryptosporangium sp. NPDC048952 TaxID=3363961 RepID=UPI00371C17D9